MYKLRQTLATVRMLDMTRDEEITDSINNYFDRANDHDRIRAAIKARYGIGITTTSDPANADQPWETFTRGEFTSQVDAGLVEAIRIGWGDKVVAALATLFTEPGQRYELISDADSEADTTDEQTYITGIREAGGLSSAIVDADKTSVQCGSGALFITAKGEGLKYQALTPADIRCYWPDTVIDGEQTRAPDYTDIEDCYAVVLRLSKVDVEKYNYLAIFGRSERWPDGRWVEYTASNNNTNLPEADYDGAIDFKIDGSPANPLSYWANHDGAEYDVPEYPIVPIVGMTKSSSTPFPVTTTLYEDELEFTVTASHILSKANSAAGGVDVLERDQVGASMPLPQTLDGVVTTLPGQTFRHETKNASDVKVGWEAVQMLMVGCAHGWSVPDYMVVSEDYALEASSGIALQVKTRPLIKARQRREESNTGSVAKIFEIEKALLNLHFPNDDASRLLDLTMKWSAGPLELPENKQEKATRIISLMDKGVIDVIAAIREYYNYPTDGEAEEEYNKMKERQSEFPPLVQEPPKQAGLFRGQQNQQKPNNG